ncbi:nucleotide sugar dehydrogenase [Pectinatus frisingensis]|uniref:nucleotide sugar dehydrogenase n=1 Tax=Pectinatus frisingensis TaxID=865 RepID=UPI0018C50B50|nr:nucleotide sugar dehydrogenase [Pectinatus frisingensis]
MSLYNDILKGKEKIAVVGLGYVGMPLAVAFAKKVNVIGFDINLKKIDGYKKGIDPTGEVGNKAIKNTLIDFTNDEKKLKDTKFCIVAVPTPVNLDKTPNLEPIISATKIVGRNLKRGSIVVYESTVYPGVTESICIPILEKESGLKCSTEFKVGYSPERINPGDKIHRLENIKKIVSGIDSKSLEEIAHIYKIIIKAGVYKASSIKVAEAAKVAENSQRDINIAFMNELAMVFDKMGICTNEVIEAMQTKWNALSFRPGLVGGHCIGVDPYYFIYEAEKLGYHSQVITIGRKINDGMGAFIANKAIQQMVLSEKIVKKAKVAILGLTFKENCPDIRNSKVIDIIKEFDRYGISLTVVDPYAEPDEVRKVYNIRLSKFEDIKNMDCIIIAVAHKEFCSLTEEKINEMFNPQLVNENKILIDVKGIIDKKLIKKEKYCYWSL